MALSNLSIDSKTLDIGNGAKVEDVKLTGGIDGTTVGQLEEYLKKAIQNKTANIVLDFTNVTYVNSTGLGLMVKFHDLAEEGGGTCQICNLPTKIEVIFNMLGLLDFFTVEESVDSAIKTITSGGEEKVAAQKSAPKESVFPIVAKCASCDCRLEFGQRGHFKCPRCSSYYLVTLEGKVKGFKDLTKHLIDLLIPVDLHFQSGICGLARDAMDKINFSETDIQQVEAALQSVLKHISDNYKGRSNLKILMVYGTFDFSIGIVCSSPYLDKNNPDHSAFLENLRTNVDRADANILASNSQLVRLSKRSSKAPLA